MKYCFIISRQGIASEFTNSEDLTINLYVCVLCGILAIWVYKFSSLSLFALVTLVLLFFSLILASYHQYWVYFLQKENKKVTMPSIRHESRWTLEYKIKYTIKDLYDIYLNISNIVNVIFPIKSRNSNKFSSIGNGGHYVDIWPI